MSQHELAVTHKEIIDKLHDLIDKTDKEKPAPKDVKALKGFLRDNPELWAYVGDVAEQAAYKLIDELQATAVLKESLKVGYERLNQELSMEQDSVLEQLLVQQIVLSWLRLAYVEYAYTSVTNGTATYEKLNYWERRLSASQRRFLRACSTLARIRKINLPPIQVNIGQQQVNQVNSRSVQ